MFQHRPGPMIEPPCVVGFYRQGLQQALHSASKFGIARSGILHAVEFGRKAAEIVNGSRRRTDGDAGSGDKPMRGNRQNRLGPARLCADLPPSHGVVVVERAFIGLPCPKNIAGRISDISRILGQTPL